MVLRLDDAEDAIGKIATHLRKHTRVVKTFVTPSCSRYLSEKNRLHIYSNSREINGMNRVAFLVSCEVHVIEGALVGMLDCHLRSI